MTEGGAVQEPCTVMADTRGENKCLGRIEAKCKAEVSKKTITSMKIERENVEQGREVKIIKDNAFNLGAEGIERQ